MTLTNRQIRHEIASTFAVLALFVVPTISHALSCAPRQFTLSEAYEAADSIIVGVITECKEEVSSDSWANGGSDCSFSSLEVLKESVPIREYNGVTSSSGCGLSLHVGSQYLLFLDSKNQPMHFSATLNGDGFQARLANGYLRTIRDFRNGVVNDLAEPWMFSRSDGDCSIWQSIGGNQIRFSRRTPDAPQQTKPDWTQELKNGETIYRTNVPTFDADMNFPAGMVEIVAFGDSLDYTGDALMLNVSFQEASLAPVRQATLSVGSKTWSLNRVELNVSLPGGLALTVINYHAVGDAAEQILSAMAKPSDIVVSATAVASKINSEPLDVPSPDQDSFVRFSSKGDYIGQFPETNSTRPAVTPGMRAAGSNGAQKEPPQPVLRMESRSTQLSSVINRFRACYARGE